MEAPTLPDMAPTGDAHQLEFSHADSQYIDDYTVALQDVRLSGRPVEVFEQTITNQVQDALSRHKALQLLIEAESLGATMNQATAGDLLNRLRQNPLLAGAGQDTAKILEELVGNVWSGHQQGMPEVTIAGALNDRIGSMLNTGGGVYSDHPVSPDETLRLALKAFFAGATVHLPEFQGRQILLDEVQSHQTLS